MNNSAMLEISEAEALKLEESLDRTLDALRELEEVEKKRRARFIQLTAESDNILNEIEMSLAHVEQTLRLPVPSFLPD